MFFLANKNLGNEIVWNGWWDENKEGKMVAIDADTNSVNDYELWASGEPNGGTLENCGAVGQHWKWYDISCHFELCVACQVPSIPVFLLRGTK